MEPEHTSEEDNKRAAMEESRTEEEEGEYIVNDLVWGKVSGHPWWPGQIFEPSAASRKAMKYRKKDSYLIAYFGDHTFAWNDVSRIKPFRKYFSQMEKQSNAEAFRHALDAALDEVSRRIEFCLSCRCVPQELQAKFKFQNVENRGIRKESCEREGADSFSTAASLSPSVLVRDLKSLATSQFDKVDRLGFVVARAQLLSFNRWKFRYEPSPVVESGVLLESDAGISHGGDETVPDCSGDDRVDSGKGKETGSAKRRLRSGDNECKGKKAKSISSGEKDCTEDDRVNSGKGKETGSAKCRLRSGDNECKGNKEKLISSSEKDCTEKADRKANISSSGNKHVVSGLSSSEVKGKRAKTLKTHETVNKDQSLQPKKLLGFGERIQRAAIRIGGSSPVLKSAVEFPSPQEMFSKLSLAAKDPMNGYTMLSSFSRFLCNFRNSFSSENADLYDPEEQVLSEPETEVEKNSPNGQPEAVADKPNTEKQETDYMVLDAESEDPSHHTDIKEVVRAIVESESEDPSHHVDAKEEERTIAEPEPKVPSHDVDAKEEDKTTVESESEKPSGLADGNAEESNPTALILNFQNSESVPSGEDLNKIFSRFGPLDESQTEGLGNTKRAKVVFKRRSDAETAYSAGKYSNFGPSLISYRLHYPPTPPDTSHV